MLFCVSAARFPRVMVASASTAKMFGMVNIGLWVTTYTVEAARTTLIAATKPAFLVAAAKRVLTVMGAPSYASGTHMWNGTIDILNPKPTMNNRIATIEIGSEDCAANALTT